MKVGETIKVRRVASGLYQIETSREVYVGSAASTIVVLSRFVFLEEANGDAIPEAKAG